MNWLSLRRRSDARWISLTARSVVLTLVGLACWSLAGGCRQDRPDVGDYEASPTNDAAWREELFAFALDNLHRLEQFDAETMLPDITARLNEWIELVEVPPQQPLEPVLDEMLASYSGLQQVQQLRATQLTREDVRFLREAIWMRDAAASAATDPALAARLPDLSIADRQLAAERSQVARAWRLFDWTVRNIALDEAAGDDAPDTAAMLPWQIMLRGRGTAQQRGWVFALLARQQGLDVVLLTGDAAGSKSPSGPCLMGVVVGSSNSDSAPKLFVFDAWLGLPIPGVNDEPVATLHALRADDALFRSLDIDDEHLYPLSASAMQSVTAHIEASPGYLARRLRVVEGHLAGEQKMVLHANVAQLAERLDAVEGIDEVRLWEMPLRTYERQADDAVTSDIATGLPGAGADELPEAYRPWLLALSRARALHLRGRFSGPGSALERYQRARPSDKQIEAAVAGEAPPRDVVARDTNAAPTPPRALTEGEAARIRRAKQDASYWLGLLAFERGDYDTAVDYFAQRTLAATPDGPWTAAAQYNLGRALEASGDPTSAIEHYEFADSPQRHGNLLRARSLQTVAESDESES